MKRLDGLSAYMVYNERPKWYNHTLKIAILDYGDQAIPTVAAFKKDLLAQMHLAPHLRWKLARVPLGIHHPVWVLADDFDIDYHVRHVSCPAPGDDRAFCQLVSECYSSPMDLSAPLWVTWVVEGLAGGRVALLTLVHHAYSDGLGTARMLQRLLVGGRFREGPTASLGHDVNPGPVRMFLVGLAQLPLTFARHLPTVVRGIRRLAKYRKRRKASGEPLPPEPGDSPYSILHTALSHRRVFAYKTFPFATVRTASKHLKVTINDLFVAVCAGAIRRFLQDSDVDPDAGPMIASIPVSYRPPLEEDDLMGNMVGTGHLSVPVHIADPRERLQASRASARVMKSYLADTKDINISCIMDLFPPLYARVTGWIHDRFSGEKLNLAGDMILSNVAGPSEVLHRGGATIENWLSIGQLSGGTGLNITVWSYGDKFNFNIMADPKVIPDIWAFVDHIDAAMVEYLAFTG